MQKQYSGDLQYSKLAGAVVDADVHLHASSPDAEPAKVVHVSVLLHD